MITTNSTVKFNTLKCHDDEKGKLRKGKPTILITLSLFRMFTMFISQYFECSQCLFKMLEENAVYQKTGQSERIIIHILNDVLN